LRHAVTRAARGIGSVVDQSGLAVGLDERVDSAPSTTVAILT
jgi:hypothetical protein